MLETASREVLVDEPVNELPAQWLPEYAHPEDEDPLYPIPRVPQEFLEGPHAIPKDVITEIATSFVGYWDEQEEIIDQIQENEFAAVRDRQESFVHELAFYQSVDTAVTNQAKRTPGEDVLAIFDLDDTVGHKREATDERFLRPAFPVLATKLSEQLGERLHIGTLTTMRQEYLDSDKNFRMLMADIPGVDPHYLISSRDSDYVKDPELTRISRRGTPVEQAELVSAIINPDLIGPDGKPTTDDPELNEVLRDYWDPKLKVVNDLKDEIPTVYVDDLPSALVIDPNNKRVSAVHINRQRDFQLPDNYNSFNLLDPEEEARLKTKAKEYHDTLSYRIDRWANRQLAADETEIDAAIRASLAVGSIALAGYELSTSDHPDVPSQV